MAKDLIEIPDFNPDCVYYIIEVEQNINRKIWQTASRPIIIRYRRGPAEKEQQRYWAKFVFKTYHGDPLEPLWKIQRIYPKLQYNRFILKKEEKFIPRYLPAIHNELYYIVKYLEIRESLLTYLRNKVDKRCIPLVESLQNLFGQPAKLGWDEFIEKKAKFLSELDLSNYVKDLNKQINKKN